VSETTPPPQLIGQAAELLVRQIPTARPDDSAGVVRDALAGERFDSVGDVVLLDAGRLVGLVRIEDLLGARRDVPVRELMDPDPPCVAPGTDQEVAAWHAVRHEQSSIAVVDESGQFLGLIPPWRMLGVLLREHDEDMARLGGFLHDAQTARTASEEPVVKRFWHRLPWLLAGLVGAVAAALIVQGFEAQLEANVLVAFFIPGIVYMADAVGTQTETLLIRGMSVGVPVARVAGRELLTGLLVGIVLAAVFVPIGLIVWGETDVILAVALALLGACSTATVVAMSLPAALRAWGIDPAFGSGPLATVTQDLLSILIYFWIVAAFV
jgi:magnesium transporter